MTQCERILDHLQRFGGLTGWEAMRDYGIMRLPARIWDLKARGWDIRRTMENAKNRYGEPVSYARYYLEEKNDGQPAAS